MAGKRGRPKDKEKRVKANILLKPETLNKIDSRINKADPELASRGKVLDKDYE